jgi:PAS domain S-box-containing protein
MAELDIQHTARPPPETLDELYEHAPCGYLTTGADEVIVRANSTLLGLIGETRDTLLGRHVRTLLTPDAWTLYQTQCVPLLQQHGLLNEISIDLACAGGAVLPALVNWRRVDDPDGGLLGYRVMVINATERIAYERALLAERERARQQEAMVRELNADLERRVEARTAELVQLQKMESLGQLTGGVAHDFNNLLTPILITLEVLHRRYLTDERALRMAASALSAAQRARTLVARLLAFARRQHLRAKAVDLGRLTDGMAPVIRQSAGPLITVRISMAAALPPARVDQDQLEMVLLSLCNNARDAMPSGGELTISGDALTTEYAGELPAGHYVRLAVSDTGPGMDPETLRRATEPFYSTKGVGKGTGLGLSMVHGLAAQSGGMLVLESTRGRGTTATVWLPVDQSAVPDVRPAMPARAATLERGLSILLVDDDELVRDATGEMLADLGHTITQASSGAQALDALRQHAAFDLLITDYLMPNMTGVGLARTARLAQPALPVLLVTGYANIKDMDVGGLPRLSKPFGRNDLSNAITETLAGATGPRTARRSLV